MVRISTAATAAQTTVRTTTRTLTSDRGDEVITSMTDNEAITRLRDVVAGTLPAGSGGKEFAGKLIWAWDNGKYPLSRNQLVWVHKLAIEAVQRSAPQPAKRVVPLGDFSKIAELFRHAGSQLKFPKIQFAFEDGTKLKLSLAGPTARRPGTVNVVTGDGDVWYGRISVEGVFEPGRESNADIESKLKAFAADPAGFAGAWGRQSGFCCFCSRELTDERSTEKGYGPVCAERYLLPWG
jgi:hypothetical protein